jgi:Ca2+-binding RTX toxin-like protein
VRAVRCLVLSVVAAALVAPGAQAADGETCQGKPATIVQTTGTVQGTGGDDVIVGGHDTKVVAGSGEDTVCGTGGQVDGGAGVDSVEVRGIDHEEFMTLTDLEHLDVDLAVGIDGVRLKWTETPAELSGSINGGDDTDIVTARAEHVTVDLQKGRIKLGPGASLTVGGFENAGAFGRRARLRGDDERNYLYISGCDIAARGGEGRDRLWVPRKKVVGDCDGALLRGGSGNDKFRGTPRNDVLVGGPGRDVADGNAGIDTCVAEKEYDCES